MPGPQFIDSKSNLRIQIRLDKSQLCYATGIFRLPHIFLVIIAKRKLNWDSLISVKIHLVVDWFIYLDRLDL